MRGDSRQRILDTGGAGFLGPHLCHRLLDDGRDVTFPLYVEADQTNLANALKKNSFQDYRCCISGGPGNTLSLLELLETLESKMGLSTELSRDDWRPGDQPV